MDKKSTVELRAGHLIQKHVSSPVFLELGQEAIHFGDLLFSRSTALCYLLSSGLTRLGTACVSLSIFTCFRTG